MSQPEFYDKLQQFKKDLEEFSKEVDGTSFGHYDVTGKLETLHFADYTSQLHDALGDLDGVMTKYYGE